MPRAVPTITPYRDGPYLVRGPVRLLGHDGQEIELGRRTVALCRCGRSSLRPFCDGTHKLIRFRAASTNAPDASDATAAASARDARRA